LQGLTESEFFERATVRLGVHEVDEHELERDPSAVDGKVLPADGGDGLGVDVDGEEATNLAPDLLETDTHGTHLVGEQLDQVRVGQGVVSDVVGWRVGKEEEQSRVLRRLVGVTVGIRVREALETNRHAHEHHDHGSGRQHEHLSARESRDNEGNDGGGDKTPALVGNVDACLGVVLGESHQLEKKVLVVRQKSVAAHLGEEAEETSDESSTTHTRGGEQVAPRVARVLHLKLDGRSNLRHFSVDKWGSGIAFCVVLCQNSKRLLITILADQPTRAFRE
jgi:hypothetical protein